MNARTPPPALVLPAPVPQALAEDDEVDLVEYWDIIVDNRWLIAAITICALLIGGAYAFLARPIYESNLLIQVEDSQTSAKSFLGDAASLFDVKTPAAAEMEILRSRMVIGKAVDSTLFYIHATPRYIPIVGNWLARRATDLSDPGFLGFGGFVHGTERISVAAFDAPDHMNGTRFTVTARGAGQYSLAHRDLPQPLLGSVGVPLVRSTPDGTVSLLVTALSGKPGAEFSLFRESRLATIDELQARLKLSEKGRQSGMIDATLQSADPQQLVLILNEIGRQYVRQNVERKAAEAEKTLAFLDAQLPQFKKQLEQSEAAYSRYRNEKGTISLDEEAKAVLQQEVDLQSKLMDARLKRLDLLSRFTPQHPSVKTLDEQIGSWSREIERLNAHVRNMPSVQQHALRLQRDVTVNNDAYQNLRNNALQLQLIREGKVGNVRLIDEAAQPESPVKPQRFLILALACVVGVLLGVMAALTRNAFFRGIRDPQEIEAHTGLAVYSTIPLSVPQEALARAAAGKHAGIHLLTLQAPADPAVESLRSLRTALQFAMLDASNNCVVITGATPGVGKSFVSANFAAIMAMAGKRVLLIDADMRKGHLNQIFGVRRERGLSEVIAGSLRAAEARHRNAIPNLDLITTGVFPPNPAELMMSTAFSQLLDELSPEYDIVVMDTPPVLVASDTVGIAPHVGTVLFVARSGLTQIGELHESAKRLAPAGKSVSGVLFNAIDLSRRHYGSYGYKYGGYRYRHYEYEPQK
jgi:tyrosine-protein kinase Etk/Wzc